MTADAKTVLDRFLSEHKDIALDWFFRSSGNIVILLDKKGGISYANRVFIDLIGSTKIEVGEPLSRYVELNRLPDLSELKKGESRDVVVPLSSIDGSVYRVEATLLPGRDVVLLIGRQSRLTHSDAVERMSKLNDDMLNLSRELTRQSAELERSNKELENFAFIASHDLQAPLRRITALSKLLVSGWSEQIDETGRDYLERIQAASSDMRAMIDGLLVLSRVTRHPLKLTSFDLNELAREVASDVKDSLGNIDARISIEKLPRLVADPVQIRQLLQNLIENGLKYHKPGEPAEVRLYESNVTSDSRISSLVRVVVEDNGIGFDASYADRIFGIFERLDGPHEVDGTGIGLSVCKKIAERHGGSVVAESEVGQGARFIVSLPKTEPNDQQREEIGL